MAAWPFSHVGAIRFDLLIHHAADIHHASNLWVPRIVILLLNGLWLEPGRELFRIVVHPAGHPARRFHTAGKYVMVGILLVVPPGVIAQDRVHLEQAKEKNQAADQFVPRNIAHAMVV